MEATPKELLLYEIEEGEVPFSDWMDSMEGQPIYGTIIARLDRVEAGNFGNHHSVGEGVSELVIDVGHGYRIYFGQDGKSIVVLLGGGTKKSQSVDIRTAKEYWRTTVSKTTKPYRAWQLDKLADPKIAANYLNASLEESPELFLRALGNVAQANRMSKVAKEAGLQRETLYRSLTEQGNPTFQTLSSILSVLGVKMLFAPEAPAKPHAVSDSNSKSA